MYEKYEKEREGKEMKKTFLSILLLVILLLVPTMVFAAEEDVAKVGEETFKTFEEALNYAKTKGEDIEILKSIDLNKDATIDISGINITGAKGITPLFTVKGASVTVKGKGTISTTEGMAFIVKGNNESNYKTVAINSSLKVEKDVKVTASSHCIFIFGNGAKTDVYGDLTTTVYDKATIQGNGLDSSRNTVINIYDGAKIEHTDKDVAIYHPQIGKLNVYGGTIKGATGIEMRAGELVVEAGTIIGTAIPVSVTPNGNGSTSYGAGIAIAQHNTKENTKLVVNGGTIQGYSAVYESNPQTNSTEEIAKVSLELNGGKFETINGGKVAVYSEDSIGFISGGTFNTEVDAKYLVKNVTSEKDSYGNYVIGTRYSVLVKETTNGTVKASSERAMEGETVKLTVTPYKGYRLSELTVNGEKVVDNKFEMPSKDATVVAKFEIIPTDVDYVVPGNKTEENNVGSVETENVKEILDSSLKANKELNKKVEEARKEGKDVKVTVSIEKIDDKDIKNEDKEKMLAVVSEDGTVYQYLDISVLVSVDNSELGKITNLTDKMKFSIKITEDLVKEGRKFFILKLHDGKVEKIEAVLNGTNLEFETDEFSTFALAYEDVKEEVKDDVSQDGEKDETPKTGAIYVSTFIWLAVAAIALVAIVKTKKVSKHSK